MGGVNVNKRRGTNIKIVIAALLLWGAAQAGAQARGDVLHGLSPRQLRQSWTFTQAIQRGDRSIIPAMIQTLHSDYDTRMRQRLLEMDHRVVFKSASAKARQIIAAGQYKTDIQDERFSGLMRLQDVIKFSDDQAKAALWAQTDPKYDDRYGLPVADLKKADDWCSKVTDLWWSDQFEDGY